MSDKIAFTQAIKGPERNSNGLSTVEAFDDYFFLSGRKYQVLSPVLEGAKSLKVKSVEVRANVPLNILKVLSYFTGIIPLIMLIGKAIARAQFEFREANRRILPEEKEVPRIIVDKTQNTINLKPILDTILLHGTDEQPPLEKKEEIAKEEAKIEQSQELLPTINLTEEEVTLTETQTETITKIEPSNIEIINQPQDNTPVPPKITEETEGETKEDQKLPQDQIPFPPKEKEIIAIEENILPESPEPSIDLPPKKKEDIKVNDEEDIPEVPNYSPVLPKTNDVEEIPEVPNYSPVLPKANDEEDIPEAPNYSPVLPKANDEEDVPLPPNYSPVLPKANDEDDIPLAPNYSPVLPKAKELSQEEIIAASANLLHIAKEIADSETSHYQSIAQHLQVMQKKEFPSALIKSESADLDFLESFLEKYEDLVQKGQPIQEILQVVTGSQEKTVEQMKAQVNEISTLFTSNNFKLYMDALIDLASLSTPFVKRVDAQKGKKLMATINQKLPFEPCNILVQRIARYPLLLKDVQKNIEKIGLTDEMKPLSQALDYFKSKSIEFDMMCEIENVKKLIADYNEAHGTFKFFNKEEKELAVKLIKSYKNDKKAELAKINDKDSNLSTLEKELKKQRQELLKIKVD